VSSRKDGSYLCYSVNEDHEFTALEGGLLQIADDKFSSVLIALDGDVSKNYLFMEMVIHYEIELDMSFLGADLNFGASAYPRDLPALEPYNSGKMGGYKPTSHEKFDKEFQHEVEGYFVKFGKYLIRAGVKYFFAEEEAIANVSRNVIMDLD
jgi:hypothetical protein